LYLRPIAKKGAISGALCLPPLFLQIPLSFIHSLSVHVHALIVFNALCAMEFSSAFEDTCFPCAGIDFFPSLYDAIDSPVEVIEADAMSICPFEYPSP